MILTLKIFPLSYVFYILEFNTWSKCQSSIIIVIYIYLSSEIETFKELNEINKARQI